MEISNKPMKAKLLIIRDYPKVDQEDILTMMESEFVFIGANYHDKPAKSIIQVKWLPPPINWFKLNYYGSSLGILAELVGVALSRMRMVPRLKVMQEPLGGLPVSQQNSGLLEMASSYASLSTCLMWLLNWMQN